MRKVAGIVLLGTTILAQSPLNHQNVLQRLGKEADLFERRAHRLACTETLTQTVPAGVRSSRGPRGIEVGLPEFRREIVSDYGFVSMDEPGGSLREVRYVRKVDGMVWNKRATSLDSLARQIAARDVRENRKQLERFEEHGLVGFVSDLGQLILLFARGGAARYEIQFERIDEQGLAVFTYAQLDGNEAFTVYGESDQPVRQRLRGRIWFERRTELPVKISIDSERAVGKATIRDVSNVEYARSSFGILLPQRIVHQQFVGRQLHLTDVFEYSAWKEVLNGRQR